MSPFDTRPPASYRSWSVPLRTEALLALWSPQPLWPEILLSLHLFVGFLTVRPGQLPGATPGAGHSAHKQGIIPSPSSAPSLCHLPQPHTPSPAICHTHSPSWPPFPSNVFLICPGTVTTLGFPAWSNQLQLQASESLGCVTQRLAWRWSDCRNGVFSSLPLFSSRTRASWGIFLLLHSSPSLACGRPSVGALEEKRGWKAQGGCTAH